MAVAPRTSRALSTSSGEKVDSHTLNNEARKGEAGGVAGREEGRGAGVVNAVPVVVDDAAATADTEGAERGVGVAL